MKYHLDISTRETWEKFTATDATKTGFEEKYRRLAEERVGQGDIFLCYLKGLKRWCGALEVQSVPPDNSGDTEPTPYVSRSSPLSSCHRSWQCPYESSGFSKPCP